MKSLLIYTFSLFFINISYLNASAETSGKLIFSKKAKEVEVGDTVDARLDLMPKNLIGNFTAEDLEKKRLANLFYISKVDKIKVSQNNSDILEVYLTLTLLKGFKHTSLHVIKIKDQEFKISLENIIPKISDHFLPKFILLGDEFQVKPQNEMRWYEICLFIFLSLIIFILILKLKSKILKIRSFNKYYKNLNSWELKFQKAKGRIDYENLYKIKDEFLKIFKGEKSKFEIFFNIINNHQYKREWDETIFEEIKKSKAELIPIFKE